MPQRRKTGGLPLVSGCRRVYGAGFSLRWFINRRRVAASIPLLQATSDTLVGISHALGFSSQPHFTHLFSTFTGMTPAKYRKQFRRTVGWRARSSFTHEG